MNEALRGEDRVRHEGVDAGFVLRLAKRRWGVLLICLLAGLTGAVLYINAQTPTYVSSAKLLIEANHSLGDSPYPENVAAVDSAHVDSQAEILRASIIAEIVIGEMTLISDPEFVPPRDSGSSWRPIVERIQSTLADLPVLDRMLPWDAADLSRPPTPRTESEIFDTAVASFGDRITVRRLGQSNVIEIDFYANSPAKAARIVGATVDAYLSGAWREKMSPNAFRRFNSDVMKNSLAVSNVRVISAALPALGKSSPKSSLILAFVVCLSLFVGFSLAIWLEAQQAARRRRGHIDADTYVAADSSPMRDRAPLEKSGVPFKEPLR